MQKNDLSTRVDRPAAAREPKLVLMRTALAVSLLAALAAALTPSPASAQVATPAATPATASATANAAAASAAGLAAMQDSVATVNQLIATENLAAVAKARKDAEAAGLIKSTPVAAPGTSASGAPGPLPPTAFEVLAIAGMDGRLHSRLLYNGTRFDGVRVGDRVDGCSVASIDGRKVVLKAAARGVPASQCPSAVWTGMRATSLTPSPYAGMAGAAMPTPVMLGGPQGFSAGTAPSFPLARSVPVAAGADGQSIGLGGPAALPLSVAQPTIELVPARSLAPGETSVPLVPREVRANATN